MEAEPPAHCFARSAIEVQVQYSICCQLACGCALVNRTCAMRRVNNVDPVGLGAKTIQTAA